MPAPADQFIFDSYTFDQVRNHLTFTYLVTLQDGTQHRFDEELTFSPDVRLQGIPTILRESLFQSLHLVLGLSYWKLFCPPSISVKTAKLTVQQAEFWNTVYTKGLGEFFYKNSIDFRGLIQFPVAAKTAAEPTAIETENRSILPVGGGKDSIVSAELLKEKSKPFDVFLLNEHPLQKNIIRELDANSFIVRRTLSDAALVLIRDGKTYNGHIPITTIYSFVGLTVAAALRAKYVILSNEKSANYGNVEYLGETINHQWSKSEEFEHMLIKYVHTYLTPSILPFSILRPYYEIEVVRRFTRFPQYFPMFSSCNRNFAIKGTLGDKLWCGECPKCAFVFATLAAFLPKETVVKIFGKNLYADDTLVPLYKELLGLTEAKPFECVGTPEEMIVAMSRAQKGGEHANDVVMEMFSKEINKSAVDLQMLEEKVFMAYSQDAKIPQEFV